MAVKRPNSRRNLDMSIRRLSKGNDGYLSLRRLIADTVVCQLMPKGVVKGGSSLKIRYGDRATRATTDLDAARSEDLERFVQEFQQNLKTGWNGFSGRLVPKKPASPKGVPVGYVMQPFDIKVSYLGSPWCTVVFELGHDEIGDADHPEEIIPFEAAKALETLGFPRPQPIPLIPLSYQIAQKLHAASEAKSTRVHDLIDLQLIIANSQIDYPETLMICKRLFAYRKAQTWPPTIALNEGWAEAYEEQSSGLAVLATAAEAVDWANELISKISRAV